MRFLKICIFCIVFLALGITLVNVADLQKANTNLSNQLTQQEQTYSGRIDELSAYQEKLVERISLLEKNYQKLQTAYDELKVAYEQYILDSTLEREQIQVTVVDLRETIAVLEQNADVDAETITALRTEVTALETSLENQTTTANELQATVTQQEATIAELNTTIDTLVSELNSDLTILQEFVSSGTDIIVAEQLGNITRIRPYAFYGSTSLKSIELPDTVTNLGNNCFDKCSSLKEIKMSANIRSIGMRCFAECESLMNIDLSVCSRLSYLSGACFLNCYRLTSVRLPSVLSNIGSGVFKNCYSLVEIYNLSTVELSVGESHSSNITDYARIIHNDINVDTTIVSYVTSGDISSYYIKSYYYVNDNDYVYLYDERFGMLRTVVSFEDKVTGIQAGAFYDYNSGTFWEIVIHDGIKEIGSYALYSVSLNEITVNSNVPPTIKSDSFYSDNYIYVYVPAGTTSAYKSAWGSLFPKMSFTEISA